MKAKQILTTLFSASVLTWFTLVFMITGLNSDYIIPYSIGYFVVSALAWKAIFPRRELFVIFTQEGASFPLFILFAGGWTTVSNDLSFNYLLSVYIAFALSLTFCWIFACAFIEFTMTIAFKPEKKVKKPYVEQEDQALLSRWVDLTQADDDNCAEGTDHNLIFVSDDRLSRGNHS